MLFQINSSLKLDAEGEDGVSREGDLWTINLTIVLS